MQKRSKRPAEGDKLYMPGAEDYLSFVKQYAGEALTEDHWLVFDSLGMPREIVYVNDRWEIA
jgi:hypothetical protein